jgi:hypothetical protein
MRWMGFGKVRWEKLLEKNPEGKRQTIPET